MTENWDDKSKSERSSWPYNRDVQWCYSHAFSVYKMLFDVHVKHHSRQWCCCWASHTSFICMLREIMYWNFAVLFYVNTAVKRGLLVMLLHNIWIKTARETNEMIAIVSAAKFSQTLSLFLESVICFSCRSHITSHNESKNENIE